MSITPQSYVNTVPSSHNTGVAEPESTEKSISGCLPGDRVVFAGIIFYVFYKGGVLR